MNNYVFNDPNKPLDVNGISNYLSAAKAGNAFFAYDSYTAALSVAVAYSFQLQNPIDSGYTLYIDSIYVANSGARVVDALYVYSGGTITGNVTNINEINVKIGFPTDTTSISSDGSGLDGGTVLLQIRNLASLFTGNIMENLILTPGNSISVVAASALSVSLLASMAVRFSYWKEKN